MDDEYGPVVASYTRADFFEDGTFIEVPPVATAAAGIEMPLIITASARQEFVSGNDGGEDACLHVVLSAVARAVERSPANEVCFVVAAENLPSGQGPGSVADGLGIAPVCRRRGGR